MYLYANFKEQTRVRKGKAAVLIFVSRPLGTARCACVQMDWLYKQMACPAVKVKSYNFLYVSWVIKSKAIKGSVGLF